MELKSMLLHLWMIAFGFLIFSQGSKFSSVATIVTTTTTTTEAAAARATTPATSSSSSSSTSTTTQRADSTTTTSILDADSTTATATTITTTTRTPSTPNGEASVSRSSGSSGGSGSSKETVKSTILRSNTINEKTFLRTQSKRGLSATQLAAEAKSLTLISAATTEITKAANIQNGNNNNNNKNSNNNNNETVNTSLSIATKGSFNTTANRESDIIINSNSNNNNNQTATAKTTTTIASTIASRAQAVTIAGKLLATLTPIDGSELFNATRRNLRTSAHNNNDKATSSTNSTSSSNSRSKNNAINNISGSSGNNNSKNDNSSNKNHNSNNSNNNRNVNIADSYFHLKQHSSKFNNQGQNSDQAHNLMANSAIATKAEALVATTMTPIIAKAPAAEAAAAAAATAAFVPVNNIMLATAAAESHLIMSNSRDIEENELNVVFNRNIVKTNLATPALSATAGAAAAVTGAGAGVTTIVTFASETTLVSSTPLTTLTPTTTSTTTTIRTTRRPIPTTTLKPPPTIDDYQTIVSQAGTHAYLPCNVKQLVKKPISWLRVRDGHILTVDQTTFIADQRFQSIFSSNPERWSLQIKYVQLKDEGTYECQVSTEPKASAIVHLRIVEPKTELIGESTRHVKAGSQVKLRCIISQALEPPLFINWFYNQKQIYLHNRRGWRTEIERIDLPLPTTEAPTTPSTSTATAATGNAALTHRPDSLDGAAGSATAFTTTHTAPTTATLTIPPAVGGGNPAVGDGAGDGDEATSTPMMIGSTLVTTLSALYPTMTAAITTTSAAAPTTTTEATTATTPTTTTTTELPTTTTTMLPSSAFIKQMTIASLVIPSVVKSDSGNYTCSPSNSATRTIVLHVLNGEYSASAITSASVSWNPIIGSRGQKRYLQPWCNVATILSLLWIIKFIFARNIANFQCGRNKTVNNGDALLFCRRRRRLRHEKQSQLMATAMPLEERLPQVSTTEGKRLNCTNAANTNANNNNNSNYSTTAMLLTCVSDIRTRPMTAERILKQPATASVNNVIKSNYNNNSNNNDKKKFRQQVGLILRGISESSISGVTTTAKVAEDKT